ncbi:hypothetical protein [Bacillus sp. FJAT-50079]|uniref:hypothetical protein n=1 Tax=Bacillus sp. FJAT-50079 TaxID=2833577 RepID=UPI001BC91677|nr:hypothetical protein [Bacillus sp. FJAT-50079]MBS4209317.1 hypothetical protein [Bacillus sp. FJAT-50079]
MPDSKRNIGRNPDPHFDGKREAMINDSTGTGSTQMGVRIDYSTQSENPFHVIDLKNNDMKEFEKLTRGRKFEDK